MAPRTRSTKPSLSSNFRLGSREEPPLYQIDLSSPPEARYDQICKDYKSKIIRLATIYDALLGGSEYPRMLGFLAKHLLRRVHSSEETKELRGIANATNLPLHLAVAYNTFLDLFSGCVSGGARVRDVGKDESEGIVHFRGLDWEMEPLRDLMICVEYVRGGDVIARGVTYAGYIGVLTGVREGLSISLNYRARLNSKSSTFSNRAHQLLMLLGLRPSMASHLRNILLSPGEAPTLDHLQHTIPHLKTSPCYLTFCSPSAVLIMEKDLTTANIQTSTEFLTVTNHDRQMEEWTEEHYNEVMQKEGIPDIGGVQGFVGDSIERKECITGLRRKAGGDFGVREVKNWIKKYPLRNETTHFSCLMDPAVEGGGLVWVESCSKPVQRR